MLKDRIKEERNKRKISQQKLADNIGVSQQTIGSWETGRTEPDQSSIIKLCNYFGISPNLLLGIDTRQMPDTELSQKEKKDNENWFRTGEGQMFIETDNSIIDQLVSAYKLDDVSRKILETFLELTDKQRAAIGDYLKSLSLKLTNNNDIAATLDPQTQIHSNDSIDIELELVRYRMELEAEKKGRTLSASDEQKHA